ncbi:MAG TPA: carbohydrate binding domain-containing protein, partial [Actinotalea sp.]|nr:carbohydrate binding domain-containing protein [Actinotalea sp.]
MNGTFADGATGWRTNASNQVLSVVSSGTSAYGRLKTTATTTAVLNDQTNTVVAAQAGTVYHASVRVRAIKPAVTGDLRVREVGASTVTHATTFTLTTTDWTTVTLDFTTTQAGADLDLNVLARSLSTTQGLDIDDVSLVVVPQELVVNGTFAGGTTGWRTTATNQVLSVVSSGTSAYGRLKTTATTTAVLNDQTNTVTGSEPGAVYQASVRVRAIKPDVTGDLRVREIGTSTVTHATTFALKTTGWTTVTLDFTT